MARENKVSSKKTPLLAGVLASSLFVLVAPEILPAQNSQPAAPPAQGAATPKPVAPVSKMYMSDRVSMRAHMYYQGVWGVDELKVKYTESGEMVRFSYRVVDPVKAAALNDKAAEPSLMDLQAGVKLVVPEMEKIGKLRQTSTPIAGRSYWMAFSNSGRRVRPGDRVSVEIGHFRADGLLVE
jgi:hypothetical protein